MSSPGMSNPAAKKLAWRRNQQQAKADSKASQKAIRDSLLFEVSAEPRLHLVESRHGPRQRPQAPKSEWPALMQRDLDTIRHTASITHAAIPNPNYADGADIPRYAAIRFADCVSAEQGQALLALVESMRSLKLKFTTTEAHGQNFLQAWFGVWMKYQAAPFISAARRPKKPSLDSAVTELVETLDKTLKKSAALLRKVDEPAYNRMRQGHRDAARAAVAGATSGTHKFAVTQQAWLNKDSNRTGTSSHRMGGIGSMLAVSISTGGGTGYHYDDGDDGHFYSMILVLGEGGNLKLPETGLQVYVTPGDVVFFLANQQLHKLDINNDSPDSAGSQTVFTIWTDQQTMSYAKTDMYKNPKYKDFHCVEQNGGNVEAVDNSE
ncbi:hypothetical protein EK21DRAFT_118108 [Setomelanomma holmii]|uniref:Uncharacterized protein n=1 Tax=Setomelanomma holmii TaxID=210430 RepID=A0A9P4GYZ2_9PLEO|nr:hypothetical protein EK21DRAFT_118108 [Setomelanomma holmii]